MQICEGLERPAARHGLCVVPSVCVPKSPLRPRPTRRSLLSRTDQIVTWWDAGAPRLPFHSELSLLGGDWKFVHGLELTEKGAETLTEGEGHPRTNQWGSTP